MERYESERSSFPDMNGLVQRNSTSLNIVQRFLDALIIVSGMVVVDYYYNVGLGLEWLLLYACIGFIIYQAGANIIGFYSSWRVFPLSKELFHAAALWITTFVFVVSISVLVFNDVQHLYALLLPWGVSVGLSILAYRGVLRVCLHSLREKGFNTRNVAVVGCGETADRLIHDFKSASWMGFKVVGQFVTQETLFNESFSSRAERLHNVDDVINIARTRQIDRLYITWGMHREADIRRLVDELADTTIALYLVPELFTTDLLCSRLETVNGMLTVSIYDTPVRCGFGSLKRIEDILFSTFILLIVFFPMMIIALGVKLSSPGPVLFKQTRYGLDGRAIKIYKFRTMKVMEDGETVRQAERFDPRITPFGAFLRKTSLDELPQFINVLQGRMSIVGPRPHAVAHNEQYRRIIRGYMLRHKVKPGITGWAQINGWRGETDTLEKMRKRIEFDHDYIQQWSIALDVKIIFLTVLKGFMDKNAY